MPRYNVMYEVTCNGFDAKNSDTNDHILWVHASSKDVIALALEQADLTVKSIQCMRGRFNSNECEFDMTREDEYVDFVERVRTLSAPARKDKSSLWIKTLASCGVVNGRFVGEYRADPEMKIPAGTLVCDPAVNGEGDDITFTHNGVRYLESGQWTPRT